MRAGGVMIVSSRFGEGDTASSGLGVGGKVGSGRGRERGRESGR